MKWMPDSRATAIVRSAGPPANSAPGRARIDHQRLARGHVADAGEQLGGREPVPGKACDEADRLALVQGERLELLRAERAGEQGVVADLAMGIQRQVIGGEADVRVEQDLQPALER